MPVSLDRSDRKILIGAAAIMLLLVAATAVLSPPEAAPAPDSSSYSPGPNGAKAAYELLGDLGYSVERWTQSLPELPDDAQKTVLVLSEPQGGAANFESEALERFVRRGGRLLFTGSNVHRFLSNGGATLMPPSSATTQSYPAAAVSPITRGVPAITMAATVRWEDDGANAVPMYAHDGNAVVVAYKLGDGEVIWWARRDAAFQHGNFRARKFEFAAELAGRRGWNARFVGRVLSRRAENTFELSGGNSGGVGAAAGWNYLRDAGDGVRTSNGTDANAGGGIAIIAAGICGNAWRVVSIGRSGFGRGGNGVGKISIFSLHALGIAAHRERAADV